MNEKSLLDYILGNSSINVVEKNGRRFVYPIPEEGLRQAKGTADDPYCFNMQSGNGLYCERPRGHSGPHLAWDYYNYGPPENRFRLYLHGYWE